MRTTKTISISMPPAQLKTVERLARKENRTRSEFVREAIRRYREQPSQEDLKAAARAALLEALRAVQEDAEKTGTSKMSMGRINAEIAAYRREQRERAVRKPVK